MHPQWILPVREFTRRTAVIQVTHRRARFTDAHSGTHEDPLGTQPPHTLGTASVVSRSRHHLATEVDGNMIIMSVDRGVYCALDDIGSDVWRRLAAPVPVGQLCAALADEYRGDPARIAADTLALLGALQAQGLIDVD